MQRLPHILLLLAICCSWLVTATPTLAAPAPPSLDLTGDAQAGHVTVSWQAPGDFAVAPVYQVEEANSSDFAEARIRYEGAQTSSVRSGLSNGAYYFRARYRPKSEKGNQDWSPWSKPKRFVVEHYSLTTAGLLFALGAFVFAATAWFVSSNARQGTRAK